MNCFENALINAGVQLSPDLEIPPSVSTKQMREICERLGLRFASSGDVDITIGKDIIVYETEGDKAHAVFVDSTNTLGYAISKGVNSVIIA